MAAANTTDPTVVSGDDQTLPSYDDKDALLSFIEAGSRSIMRSADDFTARGQEEYMNLYAAVVRVLVKKRWGDRRDPDDMPGKDLMNLVRSVLKQHLENILTQCPTDDTQTLVSYYGDEWTRYNASAKLLSRVWLYHNRHHMLREKSEAKIAISTVYDFAMCSWRKNIISRLQRQLEDGCVSLVLDTAADARPVGIVRDSYLAMKFVNPETLDVANAVYEECLAQPVLAALNKDMAERTRPIEARSEVTNVVQDLESGIDAIKSRLDACLLSATVTDVVMTFVAIAASEQQRDLILAKIWELYDLDQLDDCARLYRVIKYFYKGPELLGESLQSRIRAIYETIRHDESLTEAAVDEALHAKRNAYLDIVNMYFEGDGRLKSAVEEA